jgi:hypothetical protein
MLTPGAFAANRVYPAIPAAKTSKAIPTISAAVILVSGAYAISRALIVAKKTDAT